MASELLQLGVELRVVPIGPNHTRLQVINDHSGRNAAKVPERIFQTPDETLTGLPPDDLAVSFARMTQHPAKQMRTSALALLDHPGSLAEINLQLLARRAFHPPEGQCLRTHPAQHKAAHRIIA